MPSASRPQLHLQYLDGVRGLAAFYVMLFHIWLVVKANPNAMTTPFGPAFDFLFASGHFAVVVFIALSGYCLMLPIVKSDQDGIAGGFVSYLQRRARRILPPYYAALILSLITIAVIPGLRQPGGYWTFHLPAFTVGVLLSHVLLIHNLSENWIYKINSPFWSVATEWQIYFALPVLLALRKRSGLLGMIVVAVIAGSLPQLLIHRTIGDACFHFLGIFAFGMAGAAIGFSKNRLETTLRTRMPWIVISLFCWIIAISMQRSHFHFNQSPAWDFFAGLGTVALLIYCTRFLNNDLKDASRPGILLLLESVPVVKLGNFSYSLYLIHFLIIEVLDLVLVQAHVPFVTTVAILYLIGVPLTLGVSYVFHLAFEKPFMRSKKTIQVVT